MQSVIKSRSDFSFNRELCLSFTKRLRYIESSRGIQGRCRVFDYVSFFDAQNNETQAMCEEQTTFSVNLIN